MCERGNVNLGLEMIKTYYIKDSRKISINLKSLKWITLTKTRTAHIQKYPLRRIVLNMNIVLSRRSVR